MIRKSVQRFSEKIMLKQENALPDQARSGSIVLSRDFEE